MLHELVKYGESHGLASKPGYAARRARWLIVLAENGQFVDVVQEDREYPMAPNLAFALLVGGSPPRSHFLLDSLPVATGYGAEVGGRVAQKHDTFVSLLRQAAESCPECALCATVLEDAQATARIHAALTTRKAKAADTITFVVGTRHLPELTTWHDWWDGYRATLQSTPPPDAAVAEGEMLCFVTGEAVTPLLSHPNIKGLGAVGGMSAGSYLISFDKAAFSSFGLQGSANAACAEDAAAQYVGALQDLVRKAPRPLGGMLMLHWYDRPIPAEMDLFADLTISGSQEEDEPQDVDQQSSEWPSARKKGPQARSAEQKSNEARAAIKARQVLEAVRQGNHPELTYNRYFVLQIAGAAGRISVRDWMNGDFEELVESINAWYDDLALVGPYGGEAASPDKLAASLMRLVAYRPNEKISDTFKRVNQQLPPLVPRLWRAILQGGPLPDAVAQAALAYIRSKQLRTDDDQSGDNLDRIACSLLKAWLIRRVSPNGGPLMEPKVNKEHPSPAYQTGRLLAVLAAIQNTALGDVGAGVVQRYYASASSTPALVVGRLMRNAQYHLDKIDSKGLVYWYEQQIAEIMTRLGNGLPATLTLEGQTLFALGYYQQKAEMSTKKENGAVVAADESTEMSTAGEN